MLAQTRKDLLVQKNVIRRQVLEAEENFRLQKKAVDDYFGIVLPAAIQAFEYTSKHSMTMQMTQVSVMEAQIDLFHGQEHLIDAQHMLANAFTSLGRAVGGRIISENLGGREFVHQDMLHG